MIFSDGMSQYDESVSNGIQSQSKYFSELTISFANILVEDEILLKEGNLVDVKNPEENGYVSATISDITITEKRGLKKLTLLYGGNN